jgi:hypothetical protein
VDSALAIEVHGYGDAYPTPSLSLQDAVTGKAVAGTLTEVAWDRILVRFVPTQALEPNHEYLLKGQVKPEVQRPKDATGAESLQARFTTGAGAAPALQVVGSLKVTLEPTESDDFSTCTPGPCTCTPTQKLRDTSARLELPAATGGDASRGYNVLVMVTQDTPFDFSATDGAVHVYTNGAAIVQHEAGTELVMSSLAADSEYHPCFSTQISDFSGHTLTAEPVCLKQSVPALGQPDSGKAENHPADVKQATGVGPAAADDAGCSFTPNRQAAGTWLEALIGASLALALTRRAPGLCRSRATRSRRPWGTVSRASRSALRLRKCLR